MTRNKEIADVARALQKTVEFIREVNDTQMQINAEVTKQIKHLQDEIIIMKGQQHVIDVVSGLAKKHDWR